MFFLNILISVIALVGGIYLCGSNDFTREVKNDDIFHRFVTTIGGCMALFFSALFFIACIYSPSMRENVMTLFYLAIFFGLFGGIVLNTSRGSKTHNFRQRIHKITNAFYLWGPMVLISSALIFYGGYFFDVLGLMLLIFSGICLVTRSVTRNKQQSDPA